MGALLHHIRNREPLTPGESAQIERQREAAARMRFTEADLAEPPDTVAAARTRLLVARMMRDARGQA